MPLIQQKPAIISLLASISADKTVRIRLKEGDLRVSSGAAIELVRRGNYVAKTDRTGKIRFLRTDGESIPVRLWSWPLAWHKDGRPVLQPYAPTGDYEFL